MHLDMSARTKSVQAFPAASYSSATDTSDTIDCKDYRVAKIVANLGLMGADATLAVTESDAASSGFAAVPDASFVLVDGTDDETVKYVQLDLGPRKRYLRVTLTTTTAVLASVTVELSPAKDTRHVAVDKSDELGFILS